MTGMVLTRDIITIEIHAVLLFFLARLQHGQLKFSTTGYQRLNQGSDNMLTNGVTNDVEASEGLRRMSGWSIEISRFCLGVRTEIPLRTISHRRVNQAIEQTNLWRMSSHCILAL